MKTFKDFPNSLKFWTVFLGLLGLTNLTLFFIMLIYGCNNDTPQLLIINIFIISLVLSFFSILFCGLIDVLYDLRDYDWKLRVGLLSIIGLISLPISVIVIPIMLIIYWFFKIIEFITFYLDNQYDKDIKRISKFFKVLVNTFRNS
jgi:hypothetical protein